MIIRHVMQRQVVTAKPNVTLREACQVMSKLKIGSLIVYENERILGIVTDSDILKAIATNKDPDQTKVEDIMTRNVITIEPDTSLEDAVSLMIKHKIKRLPVVENNKLIGIITASDIIVVEPKLIEGIANLLSLKLPGYRGG